MRLTFARILFVVPLLIATPPLFAQHAATAILPSSAPDCSADDTVSAANDAQTVDEQSAEKRSTLESGQTASGDGGRATLAVRRGEVSYRPPEGEDQVAARFRLAAHRFSYQEKPLRHVSDYLTIATVTFPSPVKTEIERNNTVHCEYYRPTTEKPVPAVVVLHILGGDFELSRLFCNALAHRGVAALFLKMPYYGPRREPGTARRMISSDPRETVEGMTQAVLDIRRAVAWLESREEVDAKRLGIFGISLGGITAALTTTAEPRIQKACLLLAGGDLARVALDSTRLSRERRAWEAKGGTREEFLRVISQVDPVRYASNARNRKILMLNALKDEVIPRACTDALWKAFGQPEIVWYSGGHYTVAFHLLNAIDRVTAFFQPAS